MGGRVGRDYMPHTYWQVTAAVLAIGLEALQVRACVYFGLAGTGHVPANLSYWKGSASRLLGCRIRPDWVPDKTRLARRIMPLEEVPMVGTCVSDPPLLRSSRPPDRPHQ